MKFNFNNIFFILLCFIVINNCSHLDKKVQPLNGKTRIDFRSARIYLNEGQNNKALDLFLKVHQNAPNHIETSWIIGNIYFESIENLSDFDEIIQALKSAFEYFKLTLIAFDALPDWESYTDHNRNYTFSYIKEDSEIKLESIYLLIYEIADNLFEKDIETSEQLLNELLEMFPDRTLPAWRLRLQK